MKPIWFAAALVAIASGAHAQTVYRCGPDGRVYQQVPCTGGAAIDASDPRTPEQRAGAQAIAASEARRAAQFDRDNAPPPLPEQRQAKPPKAPPHARASAASDAASAPESHKRRHPPQDPSHPLTVRLPAKPKAAASAAAQ